MSYQFERKCGHRSELVWLCRAKSDPWKPGIPWLWSRRSRVRVPSLTLIESLQAGPFLCANSPSAHRITEDIEGADLSGVSGIPTWRRHHGAYDIDALSRAVRAGDAGGVLNLTGIPGPSARRRPYIARDRRPVTGAARESQPAAAGTASKSTA